MTRQASVASVEPPRKQRPATSAPTEDWRFVPGRPAPATPSSEANVLRDSAAAPWIAPSPATPFPLAPESPGPRTPTQHALAVAPPKRPPFAPEAPAAGPAGVAIEYLGSVGDAYLVLRVGGELALLDQHAAHERVLYAKIRANAERGDAWPLAMPLELALHASQAETLQELWPRLRELGFELELTPSRSLRVGAVPASLDAAQAREFLREVLSGRARSMEDVWALMACKAAVKAGQPLAEDEARSLLAAWLAAPDREYCPHGRPALVRFSRADLERLFKRRA